MHRNKQLHSWPSLAKAIEQRFGPPTFLNPRATLFKLKQLGSIDHYQATLETLCNRITTLTPDSILQCFISGLKPHIQNELLLLKPNTISDAIEMAKLIERKYTDQPKQAFHKTTQQFSKPSNYPNTTQPFHQTPTTQTPKPSIPIKKLSPAEMNARKQHGLCFNCDEKYQWGHQCKPTHILMIIPDESTDETNPSDEIEPEPPNPKETTEDTNLTQDTC